jgi:DNA-binding response OmpR family regulator
VKKKDIHILIIEDDPSLGTVLTQALARAGYAVKLAGRPSEAQKYFSLEKYHLLIVDCMLPKINGVDFVEQLKMEYAQNFAVIFISGVFKNSAFVKDALRRADAHQFLQKPFELTEFLSTVDSIFTDTIEEEKDPLYEFLTDEKISMDKLHLVLQQTETVQGEDLALVYGFLVKARASGILNIVDKEGEASSVHFADGDIVEVNVQDKTSYFGILLIENGFTSAEDVQRNLSLNDKQPIGLRLVKAHALSPHAINFVLSQQMSIRLSKTIQANSYNVNWTPSALRSADAKISAVDFHGLLSDWIDSKISLEWLTRFYLPWMNYQLFPIENIKLFEQVKDSPMLRICPEIFKFACEGRTLSQVLEVSQHHQSEILSVLHFLLIEKLIIFKYRSKDVKDYSHMIAAIRKLLDGIEKKDHFEVLGLNQKARTKEINRAYMDLIKVFHPDKLDKNAPKELVQLTNKVFSHITEAFKVLSEPERHDQYLRELSWGKAESVFENEDKIEKGVDLLGQGRYQDAYNHFNELYKSKTKRPDLPIYLCWALLKLPKGTYKDEDVTENATQLLKKVPPEERHSAVFFLVKGLYYLHTKNREKAIVNLKNARTLDPSLTEAKRELNALRTRNREATTTFFSTIFKKKA